jgi:Tautomerase enzyme
MGFIMTNMITGSCCCGDVAVILLVRILDKDPRLTHIVIDEIPPDNWGFDGRLTSDFGAQR